MVTPYSDKSLLFLFYLMKLYNNSFLYSKKQCNKSNWFMNFFLVLNHYKKYCINMKTIWIYNKDELNFIFCLDDWNVSGTWKFFLYFSNSRNWVSHRNTNLSSFWIFKEKRFKSISISMILAFISVFSFHRRK